MENGLSQTEFKNLLSALSGLPDQSLSLVIQLLARADIFSGDDEENSMDDKAVKQEEGYCKTVEYLVSPAPDSSLDMEDDMELLTVKELANYLKVSPGTIYKRRTYRPRLLPPCINIGTEARPVLRFRLADVLAFSANDKK